MEILPGWAVWTAALAVGVTPGLAIFSATMSDRRLLYSPCHVCGLRAVACAFLGDCVPRAVRSSLYGVAAACPHGSIVRPSERQKSFGLMHSGQTRWRSK